MTFFQALFLGIVQGFTEFLPISSSGHLIFLPQIFGWPDQGLSFDVVIHLGTLLAVFLFFRHEIVKIIKSFLLWAPEKKSEYLPYRKLGLLIALSIIPAGLIGLFFGDSIEQKFRVPTFIAINLIVWGIILGIAEWYADRKKSIQVAEPLFQMNIKKALFIGIAQAAALIPGTSRSGITMTAGLFSGLDKKTAARFSFLMSVPIIGLAGTLKLVELLKQGIEKSEMFFLFVGFCGALLSGILAISFLLKIIEKWSLKPFVVYRIVIGILILIFLV